MLNVSKTTLMRSCDKNMTEKIGIPDAVLMENAANAVHDEEVSFPPPLRTASAGAQGPPIPPLPPERRGGHAVSCRKYLFFPLAFPWDVCYDRGKSQRFIPRKELFPCWIFSTFWAP